MALWDGGKPIRAIASTTGLSAGRVQTVVREYHVGDAAKRHRDAMQRGSAVLLRAILQEARA